MLLAWAFAAGIALAGATADLPALRDAVAKANEASVRAEAASTGARLRRDDESAVLARLKADRGWFAERRLRQQSAKVHGLVEAAIRAGEASRDAVSKRETARRLLRAALFAEASRLGADGDAASRAGARDRASAAYVDAGRRLGEASLIPQEDLTADPWEGLDAELPLTGVESSAELEAKARAYRDVAARIERGLEAIAPELAAADAAATTWDRLSRFRGVLERAGAATSDPRPRLAILQDRASRGRILLDRATKSATRLDAQRAAMTGIPPTVAP